jgi:fucose permease
MSKHRKSGLLLIGLAYLGFVSLGLPDGLNGVAWPSIRVTFGLPIDGLGALLLMFTAGYLVSSFASGRLLSTIGIGTLLSLSCLATGLSLIGYSLAPVWSLIVGLAVIAGLGAGAIDAGLNTFAATQFSPRMVNWLHACYGVGAAGGPAIMTSVLASNHPWQRGYAIVGVWQLALAACFLLTRRQWRTIREKRLSSPTSVRASNVATLKLPAVWLSIAMFFVYTGLEASSSVWAFSLFTESRGASMVTAGLWVSIFWCALSVGRVLSGLVANVIPWQRLIGMCILGIAFGASLIWMNVTLPLSFIGLGVMGIACAPVFPTLIAATPSQLGPGHTANGVGFQIAAAVLGQSLIPAGIGVMAHRFGLEIIGPVFQLLTLILAGLFVSLLIISSKKARLITA